jgi:hypothetical protein
VIEMEILGAIIIEGILSFIGWVCLNLWYRDGEKVEKIKNEKYAGEFSAAGKIIILNFIAGTGAIVMFGIVIFFLVTWIYRSIAN